jgi:MinD superfamily P-loop ATPase
VRDKAREVAEKKNLEWILIDGAPGIGCPVIASLSGADCALVVTEPTLSGMHDAERVIAVAHHFDIPVQVVINKFDLNPDMTKKIESYCHDNAIQLIGKLEFDESIVRAMVEGKTIPEYSNVRIKDKIKEIWDNLQSSYP